MTKRKLPPGLYDAPVTLELEHAIAAVRAEMRSDVDALDPEVAPAMLARAVAVRLGHALRAVSGKDEERVLRQLEVANAVLTLIEERVPKGGTVAEDAFASPGRRLLAVTELANMRLGEAVAPARPEIPLASSDLLVNGRHDLSIGPEVVREFASADRVDLLCSFLKWSGLRVVRDAVRELCARRPGALRIITTAYMGATDRRALDELVRLGAEVRVSYDTQRTRLHAKAWLFHRDSGFSTAFIGSSNLSAPAMLDGLEWNVRLSQVDNGAILEKFLATFEQYWEDSEFRSYDPARDAATFDEAVARQATHVDMLLPSIEVRARPHQEEILEDLAAERARGHHKNLVVAATGTGKTVVAALDFKRILKERGGRASLLFVAHRKEILEQSLATFRVVLRDGGFGELLHGGVAAPARGEHVFASVQSLHKDRLASLAPDAYDVLIVDEFHHAAADTYEQLLEHLTPKILLGLTATPERADGRTVLGWFDHRVASELRLWKALDQNLLSPFQYFGAAGPDVSEVAWRRGRYDVSQLSNVYTADDLFVKRILQEVHDKVADPSRMRALGFCVDVAHARFMADRFTRAGLAAKAVSAESPGSERAEALRALQRGDLRVLFSVDLFNEGVDLPDVDTVLFLRPTESATLFLQQLGRGLRRSEDKDCLTVLDFIGGANRRFRFDLRFRAIVGGTRRNLEDQVKRGFPQLPSGCAIRLSKEAQAAVLDNVRAALGQNGMNVLAEDLTELTREHGDVDLAMFLDKTGLELEDVYATAGRSFTELRRRAKLQWEKQTPDEVRFERAFARMLHIDDAARLDAMQELVSREKAPPADDGDAVQRMLYVLLGNARRPLGEMRDGWAELWKSPVRHELRQLLGVLDDRTRRITYPLREPALAATALQVHATYSLDEIMAAIDERSSKGGIKRIQTGVCHVPRISSDLLFITLEKSAKDYTPTTLYNDYPLSAQRFHWESQSNCHERTPTGRRYLAAHPGSGHHVMLFVRQKKTDERGVTMPYTFLGPATYRTHRGARPMQIEWDLERPMPARLYQEVKVAAG